jgi:hypothetical protein
MARHLTFQEQNLRSPQVDPLLGQFKRMPHNSSAPPPAALSLRRLDCIRMAAKRCLSKAQMTPNRRTDFKKSCR